MQRFRFHLSALVFIMCATGLGQWATLSQKPLIYFAGDSRSYLDAAFAMAMKAQWMQSLRTPGYPALLTGLYLVGGWNNYPLIIAAQVVLMSLSIVEGYILLWRMIHQRWIASGVMTLLGVNLYLLNWERSILTETLAFWSMITLVLCFEEMLRTPRLWLFFTFAVLSLIAILIHPFTVFVPAFLLLGLSFYFFRRRHLLRQWRKLLFTFILIYGCLFGYMQALWATTGFFGLTWVTNINAFGKVLEYHMQNDTVEPHDDTIRAKVDEYVRQDGWEPWTFINNQEPETYTTQGRVLGAYSRSIIIHHLARYALDTVPDIARVWLAPPEFYAPYGNAPVGNYGPYTPFPSTASGMTAMGGGPLGMTHPSYEPFWVTILLEISNLEQLGYWLLPAVILYWGLRVWKRPRERNSFLSLVLAILILCFIVFIAAGSYDEFYRLRFPMDGLMVMLSVTTGFAFCKGVMGYIHDKIVFRWRTEILPSSSIIR